MDNAKNQLVEKLQSSTNILVTVSRNPSVDQLAACVGLTLLLNKFGKHATAVFSGEVPSTLEFLQPEQTLEKNTDSLRDFIIALDKSKADKLRYKVEDEMVRIFITPYRISLSDKDLEFSQGDFNVDAVIALGVNQQEDFDAAVIAHGRILHDAVVIGIATTSGAQLGSINWSEPNASSLSELVVGLAHSLGDNLLDAQVATALLTGIVSETHRFSNEKTTPQTMSISAELMAAGANQQLVATKLEEPETTPVSANNQPVASSADSHQTDTPAPAKTSADGTLEIDHDSIEAVLEDLKATENETELPEVAETDEPAAQESELPAPVNPVAEPAPAGNEPSNKSSRLIIEPPTLGGTLTANSQPEQLDPGNDILGVSDTPPPALLSRTPDPTPEPMTVIEPKAEEHIAAPTPPAPASRPEPLLTGFTPPPPSLVAAMQDAGNQFNAPQPQPEPDAVEKTLAELEAEVHSPHVEAEAPESLDTARDEVMRALSSQPLPPEPVQALGAQPLGDPLRPIDTVETASVPTSSFSDVLNQVIPPAPTDSTMPIPPATPLPTPQPQVNDPNAPPPVPPPIPFNFGTPPQQ
ncbi:hypothetical protein H7Y63_02415 [Polaromonas sp.]|nr:hypothetical protein [Candidatus Saccharibacteria bacterium]